MHNQWVRLDELLTTPALAAGTVISPGDPAATVRDLVVAEAAAEVAGAGPDSVLVLTRAGAGTVRSFRLDVLMARAAHAGVRLVVLPAVARHLPRPHAEFAGRVCAVAVDPVAPIGDVVVALTRQLVSADGRVVRRLLDASAALDRLDRLGPPRPGADEAALVDVLTEAGVPARLWDAGDDVPPGLLVEPADEGRVWAAPPGELPPGAARLLLRAAGGRLLAAATGSASPDLTLASLLGEILSSDVVGRELRHRAQTLGFPVDGWHLALAAEVDDAAAPGADRFRLEETVRRVVLRRLQAEADGWAWAHRASSLVFVRSWVRSPTGTQLDAAADAGRAAVGAVRDALPASVTVTAGRSTAHPHVDGLARAVSEARSAVRYSRARGSSETVTTFDEFGLEQALVDWYLSDGAAAAAARLAPLTALPPGRGEPLLRTLRVFLDHQGSVSATARALFLHRNAVRYRIDQIKELLGTDLSDPDERLSLQLACRGRALTSPPDPH